MSNLRYKIGVIEDSRIISELLVLQLRLNPEYNVRLFHSGEDFFEATDYRPDLLILDFYLDDENRQAMNGMEVALRLKNIPIVIMSGQKDLSTAIKMIHLGACDYVIKDDDLSENIDKSIKNIILTLRSNCKIEALNKKTTIDLLRMSLFFSLMMLAVVVSMFL